MKLIITLSAILLASCANTVKTDRVTKSVVVCTKNNICEIQQVGRN